MPGHRDRGIRFKLPTRIRSLMKLVDGFTPRLLLADRIAAMPGVTVIDNDSDKGPMVVRVMLTRSADSSHTTAGEQPFAEISRDGIVVYGLRSWDKHQVLCRGWGKLRNRGVLLFLPRDERELEICWSILSRAYDHLTAESAARSRHLVPMAGLPRPVAPRLK